MGEYVHLDKEEMCGYYDETTGTTVDDTIVTLVCTEWSDVCTNGIPSFETMCTN